MRVAVCLSLNETPDMSKFRDQVVAMTASSLVEYFLKILGAAFGGGSWGLENENAEGVLLMLEQEDKARMSREKKGRSIVFNK